MNDSRLSSSVTARNRGPILDVLRAVLPMKGLALEIASGAGEHIVHFAKHLPALKFCPSDPNAEARESALAWIAYSGVTNVMAPLALDAARAPWPIAHADAIICINMVHISPWSATEGLFNSARAILPAGAPLYLYGPYKRGGAHTASSNGEFDLSLRARNDSWGVRNLEEVADCAARNGFAGPEIIEMPANNFSLVFRLSAKIVDWRGDGGGGSPTEPVSAAKTLANRERTGSLQKSWCLRRKEHVLTIGESTSCH